MASSPTKQRSSQARRARPKTSKNGGAAADKNGRSTVRRAKDAVTPDGGSAGSGGSAAAKVLPGSVGAKVLRKVAGKAAKTIARKSLQSAAAAIRLAADRTASAGRSAVEAGISKRLPIQGSVDVAVPLNVAWQEWMGFGSIPEGVHRIEDVERDGDSLYGHVAGPRSADWEAEIVDEREHQSFAWRSVQGTDTAGLVTFHRLSDRLTRIELDLDVLPTNPAEALTMASHLAQRRAQADLRRFKAHVEFISPDAYETESGQNGSSG
jgi:uncharacterized membrane protein